MKWIWIFLLLPAFAAAQDSVSYYRWNPDTQTTEVVVVDHDPSYYDCLQLIYPPEEREPEKPFVYPTLVCDTYNAERFCDHGWLWRGGVRETEWTREELLEKQKAPK